MVESADLKLSSFMKIDFKSIKLTTENLNLKKPEIISQVLEENHIDSMNIF